MWKLSHYYKFFHQVQTRHTCYVTCTLQCVLGGGEGYLILDVSNLTYVDLSLNCKEIRYEVFQNVGTVPRVAVLEGISLTIIVPITTASNFTLPYST